MALPKLLSDRELNTIRGKSMVGHAIPKEIMSVFGHLDSIEMWLDRVQCDDTFGTEGWRHAIGHPDAD